MSYRNAQAGWKNIKIESRRKIIKSAICNLSWFKMFTKKSTMLLLHPWKIIHRKKARHEPSGWAMFTRCSFDKKENKLNYYKGKDCIEKLFKKLKELQ